MAPADRPVFDPAQALAASESSAFGESESADVSHRAPAEYVVIARRYRPQDFGQLIGQQHVAQALSNAIAAGRVGHAYLFTGARGVGKTSTARILAKSLNCTHGPTPTPCNRCDVCLSISQGEDIDVLEIDGASNRGIDEIRQLRQNVGIRPSRARFKIYIIDEVHMLTREAFNALLKTLEEPPEHVKFIFCTTEPTKIPITILSRCQRFDFAAVEGKTIAQRLRQIVDTEGVEAEPEALQILARRAAGSLRDSQSLLEQLLAFAPGKITVADVHGMLGTAGDERMAGLLSRLVERDASGAMSALDAALAEGVDAASLLEQLLGILRDAMLAAADCPRELMLYCGPQSEARVVEAGRRWGLGTVLAAMQIVDHALARIRVSTQTRLLAELALVRICGLAELDDLAEVVAQLRAGGVPSVTVVARPNAAPAALPARALATPHSDSALPALVPQALGPTAAAEAASADSAVAQGGAKKNAPLMTAGPQAGLPMNDNTGPAGETPSAVAAHGARGPHTAVTSLPEAGEAEEAGGIELTAATATLVWTTALQRLPGMIADHARMFDRVALAAPGRLVVSFRPGYAFQKTACERADQVQRFEQALAAVVGSHVRVEFRLGESEPSPAATVARPRVVSPHLRLLEVMRHPLLHRAAELFGAQAVRVDEPSPPDAAEKKQ